MGRAEEHAPGLDHDGPAVGEDLYGDGWHADILDDRNRRPNHWPVELAQPP
jgi:hypothetical protein